MSIQITTRLAPLVMLVVSVSQLAANPVAINQKTKIEFASLQQARQILAKRDRFIQQMSGMDRQLRLKSLTSVSEEAFLRFVVQQAVAWKDGEIERITRVLEEIRPLLKSYQPLWPETVVLIKTTGLEESDAAHCRGAAIVVPRSDLTRDPKALKRLLLHELFHVLSSHSPQVRGELYRVIGFVECADISLPATLQSRKLTNPDAPAVNCLITLEDDGQTRVATPIIFSRQASYESMADRSLFGELEFRLMIVEQDGDQWRAKITGENPELLLPKNQPSFHAQIGRNTGYIIHPEEILAENFVRLALQANDLPDPWIVRKMRVILSP